jgi:preprotein translocase subunit SecE
MARTSPVQFISQVRAEVAKIIWPTRREVALTSLMVFLLAVFAAIFFSLVDMVIRFGLTSTLNFFGS